MLAVALSSLPVLVIFVATPLRSVAPPPDSKVDERFFSGDRPVQNVVNQAVVWASSLPLVAPAVAVIERGVLFTVVGADDTVGDDSDPPELGSVMLGADEKPIDPSDIPDMPELVESPDVSELVESPDVPELVESPDIAELVSDGSAELVSDGSADKSVADVSLELMLVFESALVVGVMLDGVAVEFDEHALVRTTSAAPAESRTLLFILNPPE